jgi:hypothetical protein
MYAFAALNDLHVSFFESGLLMDYDNEPGAMKPAEENRLVRSLRSCIETLDEARGMDIIYDSVEFEATAAQMSDGRDAAQEALDLLGSGRFQARRWSCSSPARRLECPTPALVADQVSGLSGRATLCSRVARLSRRRLQRTSGGCCRLR